MPSVPATIYVYLIRSAHISVTSQTAHAKGCSALQALESICKPLDACYLRLASRTDVASTLNIVKLEQLLCKLLYEAPQLVLIERLAHRTAEEGVCLCITSM